MLLSLYFSHSTPVVHLISLSISCSITLFSRFYHSTPTFMSKKLLSIDGIGGFKDSSGRTVVLRGINLDSSAKLPKQQPSTFSHPDSSFWDGDNVSYVNRPFTLEEAPSHLERIKEWGFNTIRYIYTWEALEHKGP